MEIKIDVFLNGSKNPAENHELVGDKGILNVEDIISINIQDIKNLEKILTQFLCIFPTLKMDIFKFIEFFFEQKYLECISIANRMKNLCNKQKTSIEKKGEHLHVIFNDQNIKQIALKNIQGDISILDKFLTFLNDYSELRKKFVRKKIVISYVNKKELIKYICQNIEQEYNKLNQSAPSIKEIEAYYKNYSQSKADNSNETSEISYAESALVNKPKFASDI